MNDIVIKAQNVDLSSCDREQVQFSGAVQPHGCMLVIEEPSLRILQFSTNCTELLGVPLAELLGGTLETALAARTPAVAGRLKDELLENGPAHLARLSGSDLRSGRALNLFGHRCGGATILEFEIIAERADRPTLDLQSGLRATIAALHDTKTLQAFFDSAVSEIRRLTGFERVMVYRFLDDDSGHVIAESTAEGIQSYLDLHFPASDIPQPARRLLELSGLRHLPDADYEPIPLIPEFAPGAGGPIDLSRALLRSVSVMSTRYLRNMGVKAAMVMPLKREGVLWGLLVCHHESAPRHVDYESRTAAEFLTHMISLTMVAKEDAESLSDRARMKAVFEGMMNALQANLELHASLGGEGPANIGAYIESGGAALVTKGRITTLGETPSDEDIKDLVSFLTHSPDLVLVSDRLSECYPPAARYAGAAAGILAVRLSQQSPDFAIWFRPEQAQAVRWAGDPNKPVEVDEKDGAIRLMPRTSFAIWKESVEGRSAPWADFEIAAAGDLRRAIVEVVLEARNARLAAIVACSSDAIVSNTLDGTVTSWNAEAERLFGLGAEEMIGRSIARIVPPDAIDQETALLARLGAGEHIDRHETVRVARDGRQLDVSLTISPLRDAKGVIFGALNIIRDITDRKHGELALKETRDALLQSRIHMRHAADAAGLTYAQFDLAAKWVRTAKNYEHVMGYKPRTPADGGTLAEARSGLLEHVAEADRPMVSAMFETVLAGGGGKLQFRTIGDDGVERWFEGDCRPEPNIEGSTPQLLVTFLDISAAKAAELALRQSKFEAERANRAKSVFLATMSHDIRTPMNGVIGMASLLDETTLSAEQKHYVETIRQSGEALVKLIDDILDFSKFEAGRVEIERRPFSPISLVENVIDILEPTASRKNLRMEMDIQGDPPLQAFGDAMRLRQVLLNLTGNSIKFTHSGRIWLRLIGLAGDRLRFEVHDTGIGVAEENRDRLFQVFSQVDPSITRKFGGTGLGLAISKRLVEAMGGRIDFDSAPGAGSLFWFEIPVEPDLSAVAPRASRKRAALICSEARGAKSAAAVLAASGFDLVGPDAAEWIFVDSHQERSATSGLVAQNRKIVAFGGDSHKFETRFTAVIGGALTPGRIARILESLETSGSSREESQYRAPKSPRQLKILIADDTQTNQQVLLGLLRRLNHEVAVADNGREALDLVKCHDYDLIFMDVHMPELDGLEATRRIRALGGKKASVRIVAITASVFVSDIEACRLAGMDDFVAKPIDRKKLTAILEKAGSGVFARR
ncbi:ATP-binding protein [uncultured Rhodoblastus sp.]|uniref:ATP-binding protein n=1 Tax=uncultured Rhodoblastus sp. TaxID=543037 RepID=UPI0025CCFD32|nr:ATP-binding protein [uncultured Rhodoblastus sp.]